VKGLKRLRFPQRTRQVESEVTVQQMARSAAVVLLVLGASVHVTAQANPDDTVPNARLNAVRAVNHGAGPWLTAELPAEADTVGHVKVGRRGVLLAAVNSMGQHASHDVYTIWIGDAAAPFVEDNMGTRLAMRPDRSLQASTSTRSGARARSKTRIVAGAILGGVGGFFTGGFLGAHIEGDRCNCDDPGVVGFLIGAPIGAVAGAIAGARFLF
jgi:hypothetical protein